ncbi:hypothetical protein ACKWTF_016957, partial [Chironomus riparius]
SEYKTQPPVDVVRPPEEIQAFRSVVYNDLLDSERAHCAELRGLLENFLEPLETSQILNKDEFAQLISNFVEVVDLHEELLKDFEECNDRVGKLFLSKAPKMKLIHQTYCAMHPKAIVIVDKYKENLNVFMENQGAAKPGILVLTTGLSKCFRRLEKYAAILQELQRHMEVSHPDRGDTQRSIEVYKELAASVAAIRRQKELELQILTGPIRGWEGEELSKMGEIIHMGSCAVGKDHVDRYFILLEQNLLILSVSQRMSAFKFEGKIPISGINAARLPDTEKIKNAFEITGPLIERIVAICQSTNEASKWVELLGKNNLGSIDIKRNTSFSSVAHLQPMSMSPIIGSQTRSSSSSMQQINQHKRSLSFNHHLSYNQVVAQQQTQQPQQHQAFLKPLLTQRKEIVPTSPNIKNAQTKNNWSITHLRPSNPCIASSQSNSQLKFELSTKRPQPTYEEDALVLRVIEAYSIAFQNTSRNTIHSALLQPFAPCLPIRGGKLQSSKHFSSSNPQLPYICSSLASFINNHHHHQHLSNSSSPSINSSVVWREVCPNNFNLYTSSISSLNSSPYKLRYSTGKNEFRAASEERPPKGFIDQKFHGNLKKIPSSYDNNNTNSSANSPLISRKSSLQQNKIWGKSQSPTPQQMKQKQFNTIAVNSREKSPFLYDRRLNKSFETANGLLTENMNCHNDKGMKNSLFRRSSTPQLHSVYYDGNNPRDSVASSWCCGNFVVKQWKKMHQQY